MSKRVTKKMREFAEEWANSYADSLAECDLECWSDHAKDMNWNCVNDLYCEYEKWANKMTDGYLDASEAFVEAFAAEFADGDEDDDVWGLADKVCGYGTLGYDFNKDILGREYNALISYEEEVCAETVKEYIDAVTARVPVSIMYTLKRVVGYIEEYNWSYDVYTRTNFKGDFVKTDIDVLANCDVYNRRIAYIWNNEDENRIEVELTDGENNITDEMMELFVKIYGEEEE